MLLHKSLNVNNVWKGTRRYINIFRSILQKNGRATNWCIGALVCQCVGAVVVERRGGEQEGKREEQKTSCN